MYQIKPPENVTINCGGHSIATQTNVKYLDLIINNILSFENHIKYVEQKMACAIGIMGKLKHYFPKKKP